MQWRVVLKSGETGFAQSSSNEHMKVLSLDSFTPAFSSGNGTTEQTFRHFKTFLLPNDSDSAATNSAQREFRRVYNTAGKCYALKSPPVCQTSNWRIGLRRRRAEDV